MTARSPGTFGLAGRALRDFWSGALDLVYPPDQACAMCGTARPDADPGPICPGCLRELFEAGPVTAPPPEPISGALGVAPYGGALKEAIHRLKYGRRPALAGPLGRIMGAIAASAGMPGDVIAPVPLHPRRERERGFNQSELLAGAAAEELGLPLSRANLRRHRYTPPQARLSGGARGDNVRGAFSVLTPGEFSGAKVILVDDVFTTGSTAAECGQALISAGAREVYVLVLAIG